jgi:DNA-binding NarL/FixJ family response regulator
MTEKTKVLIVDDHDVVVAGIRSALEKEPEFEVVGTAGEGGEALKKVKSLKPDLVVLDISMPGMSGVEAAYRIKENNQAILIVVFTMFKDKEYILSLFRAGISGYVLKDEPISDLVAALKAVHGGGNYYSEAVREILQDHMLELELGDAKHVRELKNGVAKLSDREKQVFPLLADGLRIKEIADRLCVSPKTVESHKYNIMEKLNAKSIADLTKIAIKKDLIKL